mmetsp:Transcript_22007/g.39700  ORF Transcript_22007/g.39700 Transcript_22007/m.39700 type:complete len:90 (+) Transcript_22007:855-1124(+)
MMYQLQNQLYLYQQLAQKQKKKTNNGWNPPNSTKKNNNGWNPSNSNGQQQSTISYKVLTTGQPINSKLVKGWGPTTTTTTVGPMKEYVA